MPLGRLAQACGLAVPAAVAGLPIAEVTADSRRVIPGALFVAVSGGNADGHDFLAQAVAAGCRAVVVERPIAAKGLGVPVVRVADSRKALGLLLAAWYGEAAQRVTTVALTGTNGKTTTAYLVESMLRAAGRRPGVVGTVEYRCHAFRQAASLTTPGPEDLHAIVARMAAAGVSHLVMEASSHALEQERLAGLSVDVAAFTNLSRDHLDYHGDMERYFQAKARLFTDYLHPAGAAVIGEPVAAGSALALSFARRLQGLAARRGARILRCGAGEGAEIRLVEHEEGLWGLRAVVATPAGRVECRSPLIGRHNLENLLLAAGIGVALGLTAEEISAGLSCPLQVPGRLERVGERPAVFVDYAHTPDGLRQVLTALRPLVSGRLVLLFGCGGDRDSGKRPLMGGVAARLADVVVLTTDNPRTEPPAAILAAVEDGVVAAGMRRCRLELALAQGWRGVYEVIADRRAAIHTLIGRAKPDDVVLLAGKGHENYQILGKRRIFFDDRLEARVALAQRADGGAGWRFSSPLKNGLYAAQGRGAGFRRL